MTLPIDPITAALGGAVEVAAPYGKEKIDIKAGTTSKTILKLPRKGIKTSDNVGDLII